VTAVALAVLLSACGGDNDGGGNKGDGRQPEKAGSASAASPEPGTSEGDAGEAVPDTSKTLATINSSDGFQLVLHSAARDQGGFLTVTGSLKNTTSQALSAPLEWNGEELSVKKTGPSFAGATLIDKKDKKRYYVLRDTEGFPLTTTGVTMVKPGQTIVIFAQFPAPPATTTNVDFQLPLMPPAPIEIS
jgi:hypothetical protein